MNKPITES